MGDDFIDDVEDELDELVASEHPRRYAASDDPTSSVSELQAEQQREGDEIGAPPVPFMTGPMWRGMVVGGLIGLVAGAAIASPLAIIPFFSLSAVTRLVIVLVCGGVAGAAAGAVYFGARLPELSGESIDADNTPSAGSTLADPHTDERGR